MPLTLRSLDTHSSTLALVPLIIAVAVSGGVACSTLTPAPREGVTSLTPRGERWDDALKDVTRRHVVYDWAMRMADLRAALVTPKLRAAFLKEREEFHGRFAETQHVELVGLGDPDEGVDAPMRPKPETEEQILIFVAMYVADQKNRDIAANYTVWDTYLVRGNARVQPLEIITLKQSPAVQEVYPFTDRFDDVYLFRFPMTDADGVPMFSPGKEPLRFEVKSVLAEATVEWTLSG